MTEGDSTVFVCPVLTGTVSEHRWLINGTLSTSFSDAKDTISVVEIIQLYFHQVSPKYNNTTIQCVVTFTSGKTEESNNATLRGIILCSYMMYMWLITAILYYT